MVRDLDDWSIAELATVAAASVRAEMQAGCNLIRIAACWGEKHPGEGLPLEAKMDDCVDERRLILVGDGSPDVAEGAPADLALETRQTVWQAKALIEDALDLKYRFPHIWTRIEAGNVPAWQTRQLAQRARGLTQAQAGSVDRCLVGHLGKLSKTRLDHLIDAELLRVDAEAREEAARERLTGREVRFWRPDQDQLAEFWGSMPAPDAARSEESIDHLADILISRGDDLPAGVPARGASTKAEWRSVATVLLMTNPVLANQILLQAAQPDLLDNLFTHADDQPADDHGDADHGRADHGRGGQGHGDHDGAHHHDGDRHGADHDDRDCEADVLAERAAVQGDPVQGDPVRERLVAEVVSRIDASKLLPNATLHVHLNADAFTRPDDPDTKVARVEQLGAALLPTIKTWLGDGAIVKLQPVLDPDHIAPVDRYETPQRMRDALLARTPASVFPWTGSLNRRNDLDHTIPTCRRRPGRRARPGCTISAR